MADEDPLDSFFEDVKEATKALSEKRLEELKSSIEISKQIHQEQNESEDVNASSSDPLDVFMADVKATVAVSKFSNANKNKLGNLNERFTDSVVNDGLDAYLEEQRRQKLDKDLPSVPSLLEYDSDENITGKTEKPQNLVLPPVDHSKIEYEDFHKDFYKPSKDILNMTQEDIVSMRRSLELVVTGVKNSNQTPPPIANFKQSGFDAKLTLAIGREIK
mmetsp:Transcript_925/g.1317  ORF Transcript_925/g.1317 Transcript_925/m.1317 type:complete len:218 (+) Transcript_925:181-834(+)